MGNEYIDKNYLFYQFLLMSLQITLSDEECSKIEEYKSGIINNFFLNEAIKILLNAYEAAKNSQIKAIDQTESRPEEDQYSETNVVTPLWNGLFNKGEIILLASAPGVGKTLLSIDVAKSNLVQNALFLTLEDFNKKQEQRYIRNIEDNKCLVIGKKKWEEMYESYVNALEGEASNQLLFEKISGLSISEIQRKRKDFIKMKGFAKNETQFDSVILLKSILQQYKSNHFDFICIDSLNAFFRHPSRISRSALEQLFSLYNDDTCPTLILIHHINKKGQITGSTEVVGCVDSAYILESLGLKDKRQLLQLTIVKSRYCPSGDKIRFYREKIDIDRCKHIFDENIESDFIENNYSAHIQLILNILNKFEGTEITFNELFKITQEKGYRSDSALKNVLKRMESEQLIEKVDGRTWKKIQIRGNTQEESKTF